MLEQGAFGKPKKLHISRFSGIFFEKFQRTIFGCSVILCHHQKWRISSFFSKNPEGFFFWNETFGTWTSSFSENHLKLFFRWFSENETLVSGFTERTPHFFWDFGDILVILGVEKKKHESDSAFSYDRDNTVCPKKKFLGSSEKNWVYRFQILQ